MVVGEVQGGGWGGGWKLLYETDDPKRVPTLHEEREEGVS